MHKSIFLTLLILTYANDSICDLNSVDLSSLLFQDSNVEISNIVFTGSCSGSGLVNLENTNIGEILTQSVVLTTGDLQYASSTVNIGTSGASTIASAAGDSDLTEVAGYATHDASVLEFDVQVTQSGYVSFDYIFASEEYNEFVGSSYNDVFALWIGENDDFSGTKVNVATLTSANNVVSINSVNYGINNNYFVNNYDGSLPMEYDGRTTLLSTKEYYMETDKVYHVKFAIADVYDSLYDSALFFPAGSFTAYSMAASTYFSAPMFIVGSTLSVVLVAVMMMWSAARLYQLRNTQDSFHSDKMHVEWGFVDYLMFLPILGMLNSLSPAYYSQFYAGFNWMWGLIGVGFINTWGSQIASAIGCGFSAQDSSNLYLQISGVNITSDSLLLHILSFSILLTIVLSIFAGVASLLMKSRSFLGVFTRFAMLLLVVLPFAAAFAFTVNSGVNSGLAYLLSAISLVIIAGITGVLFYGKKNNLLQDSKFLMNFGALYADYRENCTWFLIVPMFRRIAQGILVACLVCADYSHTAVAVITALLALEFGLTMIVNPYSEMKVHIVSSVLNAVRLFQVILLFGLVSNNSTNLGIDAVAVLSIVVTILMMVSMLSYSTYKLVTIAVPKKPQQQPKDIEHAAEEPIKESA